uniref:Uncharacterized protein n=1 Tax=Rhizophora mucronata TaxID=61149 RepID=A0A2P2QGI3_RHIMU
MAILPSMTLNSFLFSPQQVQNLNKMMQVWLEKRCQQEMPIQFMILSQPMVDLRQQSL